MIDKNGFPLEIGEIAWSLLDAYGDDVYIIDQAGFILFVNEPALEELKKTHPDPIGKNISEFSHFPDTSHLKIVFAQVLKTHKPVSFIRKTNGHWNQTVIHSIENQNELPPKIALCNRDITVRIDLEEKLKKAALQIVTEQENERYRISRDLHNEVGQRMTTLLFELRSIKEIVIKDQKLTINAIDNIISNVETIIKHIRQVFYQLHPPSLNRVSLPNVLEAFCSTFAESHNIHIDFSCQKEFPKLPENFTLAIYRFVQEGLTNVIRHSQATNVWINLDYAENEVSIFLEDNGEGFDQNQFKEELGLQGIRERFYVLDGTVDIESVLGKGTQLSGFLPFHIEKG